jgi:hypothetical protein
MIGYTITYDSGGVFGRYLLFQSELRVKETIGLFETTF